MARPCCRCRQVAGERAGVASARPAPRRGSTRAVAGGPPPGLLPPPALAAEPSRAGGHRARLLISRALGLARADALGCAADFAAPLAATATRLEGRGRTRRRPDRRALPIA